MIHPLTRNLICRKVDHQMSHRHHLLKLPIHPGDANVLGPRSFSHFFGAYPADHSQAYSRPSGLSTGEPSQP